jgi:PAS domain S-box-containing protein
MASTQPHAPTAPATSPLDALSDLRWVCATHLDKHRQAIVTEWAQTLRKTLELPTTSNFPDPATMALRHKELDILFRRLIASVRTNTFTELPASAVANHHEVLDHAHSLTPLLIKLNTLADITRRSIIADPTMRTVPALYYMDHVFGKLMAEATMLFAKRRRLGLNRIKEQHQQISESSVSVLNSSPVGILVTDRDGIITFFNATQETISGKQKEEVLGRKLYHNYAKRDAEPFRAAFQKAIDHGETSMFRRCRYEGSQGIQYLDVSLGPVKNVQGSITGVVQILSDVTEKALLEQKAIEQNRSLASKVKELEEAYNYIGKVNRQFSSLIDINNTISSKLSLDKILDFVVRSAAMLTKARLTTLRRLANNNTLVLMAQYGLDAQTAEKFRNVPVDKSVIGRVLQEDRSILMVDLDQETLFYLPELKQKLGLRSLVSVPLRSRGKVVGILSIHLPEKREFTMLEQNFLIALANQAALAIELEKALAPMRAAKNKQPQQYQVPPPRFMTAQTV